MKKYILIIIFVSMFASCEKNNGVDEQKSLILKTSAESSAAEFLNIIREILDLSRHDNMIEVQDLMKFIDVKWEENTVVSEWNYFYGENYLLEDPSIKISFYFYTNDVYDATNHNFIEPIKSKNPIEELTLYIKDITAKNREYIVIKLISGGKITQNLSFDPLKPIETKVK